MECQDHECHEERTRVSDRTKECWEFLFNKGGVRDILQGCVDRGREVYEEVMGKGEKKGLKYEIDFGKEAYKEVIGDGDKREGLKYEAVRKSHVRTYFLASIMAILILVGLAVRMWANNEKLMEDVPECKAQINETSKDVAILKTDTQVLKIEKTQLQKDVDSINKKIDSLDKKIDRVIDMLQREYD